MELTPIEKLALALSMQAMKAACDYMKLNEHPMFPRAMWLAVANAGQTDLGYWDWAGEIHEQTQDEVRSVIQVTKTGRMVSKAPSMQALPKLSPTAVHVPQTPATSQDFEDIMKNWSQGDLNES